MKIMNAQIQTFVLAISMPGILSIATYAQATKPKSNQTGKATNEVHYGSGV
jgi:hypothetical protein